MFPIDYLPGARRDFEESFDWYSARSTQAAVRFANAVDEAMIQIATDPLYGTCGDGVHHESTVKKFPFRIVYRINGNRVLIVAVAHAKRRPGFWRERN